MSKETSFYFKKVSHAELVNESLASCIRKDLAQEHHWEAQRMFWLAIGCTSIGILIAKVFIV